MQHDTPGDPFDQSHDQSADDINRKKNTRGILRDATSRQTNTTQSKPQPKARALRSARKPKATVKNTTRNRQTGGKSILMKGPSKNDSSSGIADVSSTYDFSDIAMHSLVISDSPPLEVATGAATVTPAATVAILKNTRASGRSHVVGGRSDRLTSTPAQAEKSSAAPGELRKSLLSHLYQAKNKSSSSNDGSFGKRKTLKAKGNKLNLLLNI